MNQTLVSEVRSSKRIVFNFICGISEHLVSAGIALLLTPFLIDRLGLELYGLYPVVLELATVFAVIFGIINSTSSRYIAIEAERGNFSEASKYFSTAFFSNLILSSVLLAPMLIASAFSYRFLSVPSGATGDVCIFMTLAFLSVISDAVAAAFGSVYYITNRLDIRAGQRLAGAVTKAGTLLLLLKLFKPSMAGVGIAMLSSSLVSLLLQVAATKKFVPSLKLSKKLFSISSVRQLSASGLWYSFNHIASVMMSGAFLVVSNIFLKPEISGTYSVAFVFSNSLSGVILTLAAIFVPISAKCFARGESKRLRDSLVRDQRVVGYFAAVSVPVGCVFCGDFFALWLGNKSSPLLIVLSVFLVLPILSLACATPIIHVAMVMNRTRKLSLIFLGASFVSLASALFVAYFSPLGAIGLAALSCLSQIIWYSVAVPIFAGRVFSCSPKRFFVPILRTFFAALLAAVCCLLLRSVCRMGGWTQLLIVGTASAVLSAVTAFFGVYKDFSSTKF
ncbi:MAG: hypothetical protein IJW79_08980 [Clostridia bacterium]|nr:hypothetical protein [Clostridia bacterium]